MDIEVFVNNVRQEPLDAYNVAGTALTMTGDVETTDDFYVVFQSRASASVVHPPESPLVCSPSLQINNSSGNNLRFQGSTFNTTGGIEFYNGDTTPAEVANIGVAASTGTMTLSSDPDGIASNSRILFDVDGTQMMRIDDSHINIGTTLTDLGAIDDQGFFIKNVPTDATQIKVELANQGTPCLMLHRSENDNQNRSLIRFKRKGANVGSISASNTTTAYNTTSDYRLKENVSTITGATERLNQLNPVRFNFIADADKTVDGFLAHEVSTVVPEAVTGEKDAVDGDGNPDYQQMDASKLIPLLVATIKELEARVTALEAG